MVLIETVPTRTGAALRPGAARQELAARLGSPQSISSLALTPTARVLNTNSSPLSCDVYRVNGLVQMGSDPYTSDWNIYPVAVILTLGLSEVFVFPLVAIDMTQRSFQRYELRVWYDASDQLMAYERRRRNIRD